MDPMLIRQACNLAQNADVVLLWMGLNEAGEAEGVDRENMKIPENQIALLNALAQVNPNIAVILSCGCAVEMDWDVNAKAILHGYLGGQGGAQAIASLVTGKANPCGKLSETVPLRYEDCASAPYYPGLELTSEYREGIYVGYRYFDSAQREVKYPFGFGLSYTTFEYSHLEVTDNAVRFRVRNTGDVFGEEVAQLYIHADTCGMFRPEQELKGFAKVTLAPGEEKEVSIPINERSFAVWSIGENNWVIEPGFYELRISASSRDIRLCARIEMDGEQLANPYENEALAPYYEALVQAVSDESFAALLGREIPNAMWDRSAPIGFNDTLSQGSYLSGGLGKWIYNFIELTRKALVAIDKKELANDLSFIMNMPWRNVARMSGILNDQQVLALLEIVNRQKGGLKKFINSLRKENHHG